MLNTVGFDCPILTAARRGNVKKDLKSEECREVLDSLQTKGEDNLPRNYVVSELLSHDW